MYRNYNIRCSKKCTKSNHHSYTRIIAPLHMHFLQYNFECRNHFRKYSFGLAAQNLLSHSAEFLIRMTNNDVWVHSCWMRRTRSRKARDLEHMEASGRLELSSSPKQCFSLIVQGSAASTLILLSHRYEPVHSKRQYIRLSAQFSHANLTSRPCELFLILIVP